MTKQFASVADLEVKKTTFAQLFHPLLGLHRRRRPQHRRHHRRRRGSHLRRPGHPGHGPEPDRRNPQGHRQTDQVRGPLPLPRRTRPRRLGLQGSGHAGDHRQPRHLRNDRRTRRTGHAVRIRAFSPPLQQFCLGARPHLADPGLRGGDEPLDGQGSRSQDHAPRPGHTKGDTVVWVPSGGGALLRRSGGGRRRLLHRRRPA